LHSGQLQPDERVESELGTVARGESPAASSG
jgi:hypothetical protein